MWEDPGSNHTVAGCIYRDSCCVSCGRIWPSLWLVLLVKYEWWSSRQSSSAICFINGVTRGKWLRSCHLCNKKILVCISCFEGTLVWQQSNNFMVLVLSLDNMVLMDQCPFHWEWLSSFPGCELMGGNQGGEPPCSCNFWTGPSRGFGVTPLAATLRNFAAVYP